MPDVTFIPALASFFGVSTDELFDFNLYEIERNVEAIVDEHSKYYDTDKEKCEQILRDGLKKYPGNDILLNCLVGVLPMPERSAEIIELCKALIESTKHDDVRHDAHRILAEAYKSIGEYALVKQAIEQIPEIYFTKLEVAAELLEGEDMFLPAVKEQGISFEKLIRMCELLADYYLSKGENDKALIQLTMAKDFILAAKNDFAIEGFRSLKDSFAPKLIEIFKKIETIH